MAMMLVKLFAALRSINVDEKLAQEAAEEAAGVDGKVAELKTGFADLKTSFAELRSEVRVVQAGTALLGVIVIGLLWQTVSLTGTVNRLDERMIGFDKRLGAVETRLAGIETVLGEIRASVAPKPTEAGPETPQPDPRDRSELAPNIAEQMRRAMSLSATRALTPEGEHHKAWEIQAAVAGVEPSSSLAARSGYHLANVARSVPSSTRVRVCSSRCAPRDDHCIC